jgi:hypothetical protein
VILPENLLGPDVIVYVPGANWMILFANKTTMSGESIEKDKADKNHSAVRPPFWLTTFSKEQKVSSLSLSCLFVTDMLFLAKRPTRRETHKKRQQYLNRSSTSTEL